MLPCGVPSVKHTQLADFIRRTMRDKGLSLRDVEERSRGRISNSYLSKLLSGSSRNPTGDKLAAIADGLGVPLKELHRATGGEPADDDDFRESVLHMLYEKAKKASPEDKRFIDRTIKHLLRDLESSEKDKAGRG